MNTSKLVIAGTIGAGVLLVTTMTGCSKDSKSTTSSTSSAASSAATSTSSAAASTTSSAAAQPSDYSGLLIKATDISAPEQFTISPPTQNPGGQPGITAAFSNPGSTHVISDKILILPDPAAAAAALDAAKGTLSNSVTGGTPTPTDVGTGGVSVAGNSPDGSKSVTVVLFTVGKAFTNLEFDGPAGAAAPPDFVADVSQKQAAAIKSGLPG
ncbi:MAG: hypothetical protein P4L86_07335 [Mycobacterium sp.]|nr:hypothetical protein [Mycobacterium sp.]